MQLIFNIRLFQEILIALLVASFNIGSDVSNRAAR
jgi:hypothetical protein